jgi:hypothetical protein
VAGRLSRHQTDGEYRHMQDDRMLWNWDVLMLFALFLIINSVLFNAAELRRLSRHVVGVPMEIRHPMTRREVASELPHSKEGCDPPHCGTPLTPPARRPAVAEFKDGSPSELILRGLTGI